MTKFHSFTCAAVATMVLLCTALVTDADQPRPLSLIVMDPLAAPLSCPCVEGYAQRKYEKLAEHLQQSLGRDVKLTFGESLALALKKSGGSADIIIGKDSVVRADADAAKIAVQPLAHLSDKQGSTEQYGLIVVNRDDPAMSVKDLTGYAIIFGPREVTEKHAAARALLSQAGITVADDHVQIDAACSDGACKVIDLGPKSKTAAVISGYAQPLLEGCGTIKKGDLRVVGKTAAVPFITAFIAGKRSAAESEAISAALQAAVTDPELLEALESLVGFIAADPEVPVVKKKS